MEYKKIKHDKYKYELTKSFRVKLNFKPGHKIVNSFYIFYHDGTLGILQGYRWDGASGPTIDTKNTMRASCVHDVLYQMIRRKELSPKYKDKADQELKRIMLEDGKPATFLGSWWNSIRANYFYYGVRWFGASSCKPGSEK